MRHEIITVLVSGVIMLGVGACAGFAVGVRESPSYQDAMRIEQRLREVFCEQAVKNNVLRTCEVMK